MATFAVLEHFQAIGEQARSHISKTKALLLVRRNEAERLGPRLIRRRRCLAQSAPLPHKLHLPAKPYIPERMPPREVPNTYFQEPQSPTWRLAHRTVVFATQS